MNGRIFLKLLVSLKEKEDDPIYRRSLYDRLNLASLVESLSPLAPFSIFTYLDTSADIFREGVQPADVLVLLSLAAVLFILALLSFQRRNVTVGHWPWKKAMAEEE